MKNFLSKNKFASFFLAALFLTLLRVDAQSVPDAPTGLTAIPGKNRALVTFTHPVNNGGSAITNYEYSTDDGLSWTPLSPASTNLSIIIAGLSNSCTSSYNVKIRAVNSAGAGEASSTVSVKPRIGTADVGWTNRNYPADRNWFNITYGNGLFVAVGDSIVMTSPDGFNWTLRNSVPNNVWTSVTYGNGLFVAVARTGIGNRVMTSSDGITWVARISAADINWYGITFGNGLFVAVGSSVTGNRVMTSPDGITWTSRTSASGNNWSSITYGNGLFVAVGYSATGDLVMTSSDGITWTGRTAPADNYWRGVTYGNGLFVAVAHSGIGNRVMTSPDGINWTIRNSAADNSWSSVTYGNGMFVAVAYTGTGNRVMTSPDGINWTARNSASDVEWKCVTYGNGQFVAVANTGTANRVMASFDALIPDMPTIDSITPKGDYAIVSFKASSSTGATSFNYYEYSIDNGNNWIRPFSAVTSNSLIITGLTPVTNYQVHLRAVNSEGIGCVSALTSFTTTNLTIPGPPTEMVITPGIGRAIVNFKASDDGGSFINNYEYSTDNGLSWIEVNPSSKSNSILVNGLTNCSTYNIKLRAINNVGVGVASTAVLVTPRSGQSAGINWTSRTPAADNSWCALTYGKGLFVAVAFTGSGNRVMTSNDGINWIIRSSAADVGWIGVAYGNGLFVAVAQSGTGNRVMTSPDGITWTSRTSASDNNWSTITYGNGLFVAVASSGTGNRVMTSADGIIWTSRTSAADNDWRSVTYGNGLFVAVARSGTGNRVMTSTNGINWTARASVSDNSWSSVAYGNGLFVAVSTSGTGNRVMTSPDGIEWTSRTSPANNNWSSITYGNGLFVAVASSGTGNRVMTSSDGITWIARNSAADNVWFSVTYGNGLFVALSTNGTRVMTSFDAIVPDQPEIVSINPGSDFAIVSFTAPASTGGTAIINYEYSINNGSNWVTPSSPIDSSPIYILGLAENSEYELQLRAINNQGTGCASSMVRTTTLSNCLPTTSTTNINLCSNQLPYFWNNANYYSEGIYTFTTTNALGCDSVASLILKINESSSSNLSASACGSYLWNGFTYTSSGTYTWIGTNAAGCDSVVSIILSITAATPNAPNSIVQTLISNDCGARQYRFSTPTLTYATGYSWIVPTSVGGVSGMTIDSGNVNNSRIIVVTFASNVAAVSDSVRVRAFSGCGNSAYKVAKLTNIILSVPTAPASITITPLQVNVCGTRIYRYSAPALSGATTTATAATGYEWSFTGTLGANATIDSGNVNSRIIVVSYTSNAASAAGDSVKVRYESACGNSLYRAAKLTNIKILPPPAPSAVTITTIQTNVCGNKKYRYSAPALPGASATAGAATGYVWSFTGTLGANAVIDSGDVNSRTIVVSFTINTAAGAGDSVKVVYTSACGNSPSKATKLTNTVIVVPAAPTAVTITAIQTNVCGARRYRYSAPNLPAGTTTAAAATGYVWDFVGSLSEFATIDSGDLNSQRFVVTFASNEAATNADSVRVYYSSSCGNSLRKGSKLSNTKLNVPAAPTAITITALQTNVCGARRYRYAAPALPSATTTAGAATGYVWSFVGTLASTLTVDSGSLTSRVLTVTFTSNAAALAGDSVRVLYTSDCGNSLRKTAKLSNTLLTVPAAPASITIALKEDVCNARKYRYIAPATLPGATTTAGAATGYLWSLPTGTVGSTGTLDSGTLNSRIIVVVYTSNAAAGAGDSIRLRYTSGCGNGAIKAQKLSNVAKLGCAPVNPITKVSTFKDSSSLCVKIFPNPTTNLFSIQIKSGVSDGVVIRVLDLQGRIIKKMVKTNTNQTISIGSELLAGVYLIEVTQGNEIKTMRVVKY
jgi:hypothetical protein